MPSFAFFDLDHTLLPFDTQTLFANFVLRRERWRTVYLLGFAPVAVARAVKLVPTVVAKRAFMGYLWKMERERVMELAREFAEQEVMRWVYPELREIIKKHREAGRVLILNTASPDFYPREIARLLGFDHCIATRIEDHAVMPFMPVVLGENNKREVKLAAMREQVQAVAAASREELADSWSYSDSAADLPLLELAGNAVLVHPAPGLAAIGRERGWEVIYPQRPYGSRMGDLGLATLQVLGLYEA